MRNQSTVARAAADAATTTSVQLQARGVRIEAGGRPILDGVDVDVRAGEVTAVIGPNGAGKSTLVAVLAGNLSPAAGEVRLAGRPLKAWGTAEAARHRAVMGQESQVAFPFTTAEVVRMGRTAWRRTEREEDDDDAVAAAMEATEISHLAPRAVTVLSGGERQRTALARVLAQEGRVVLLDEPVSAMDIARQEKTLAQCRRLAEAGSAVVVLHDLDAAAAYADRVLLMSHGRVVADGAVEEVCTAGRLTEVYGTPIEVFRTGASGRLRIAPLRGVIGGHPETY
ncbi:heme ABC transporter ATP-binding protein [Zafaria sp. Z1313]|uniref:heme ABC transporter ATP-binding protein n=1 Tax=unclassified Zafaria TaxID=2828765 RepID=UPI002E77A1F0|nr:heme ABC transporter ATP-binding protein [Zafaria sp. J156]MEE1622311.1 heme ABC transporter ATP-binding protein [Zafaria sp. J156]